VCSHVFFFFNAVRLLFSCRLCFIPPLDNSRRNHQTGESLSSYPIILRPSISHALPKSSSSYPLWRSASFLDFLVRCFCLCGPLSTLSFTRSLEDSVFQRVLYLSSHILIARFALPPLRVCGNIPRLRFLGVALPPSSARAIPLSFSPLPTRVSCQSFVRASLLQRDFLTMERERE